MERTRARGARTYLAALVAGLAILAAAAPASARTRASGVGFEVESLNGSGNNLAHPTWGEAGTVYQRMTTPRYADGVGEMVEGPNARYISNRVYNSLGVDLVSERDVSQWVWVWGQFLDHTFGRAETGEEEAPIPFNASDPLESFTDTLGSIPFNRDAVAPGTGTGPGNPREQVNTMGSYIDAASVYGNTQSRLEWLRTGPDDGNPAKAGSKLLLPHNYLPLATARHNVYGAPSMVLEGALSNNPENSIVAGDVRGNENAELTGATTLLAREHNRIVAKLPASLSSEEKFQIARRVVAAEEQYITFNEFLPAVGVTLKPYEGYEPSVDSELEDEFAVIGYRAHSMVNGEENLVVPATYYRSAQQSKLRSMGIEVKPVAGSKPAKLELTISQNAAFFDPAVVSTVGLGPLLSGLARRTWLQERRADRQLTALRPVRDSGARNRTRDVRRRTDHARAASASWRISGRSTSSARGTPACRRYNELRVAAGLTPRTTFAQAAGESAEEFPTNDPDWCR